MSSLTRRIANVQQTPNDLHIIGKYNSPDETPLMRIKIYPGLIAYEDLTPLIAADGAPIAATGKGTWGQLYAAQVI